MERIERLLKNLSESYAITGQESAIFELVKAELNGCCDSIFSDQFGNIIAFKKGRKDGSVLIACHLDEIGFMVRDIESGYLRITRLGGSDPRILPGQTVVILTEPMISGVIGIKPPHYTTREEREKVIPLDELFVDTGLDVKRLKKRVKIGDFIGLESSYLKLHGSFRSGKAFDNRVGVTCGIEILRQAKPTLDLYLILTSQEEFTGLGATITSYKIDPDYAIVIDCTHGTHPGYSGHETFQMDKGPVLATGPALDRELLKKIKKTAQDLKISYQIEPIPRQTGTDADSITLVRQGIRTMLVEVPIRYMHSPVEVVCLKDIEKTVRLLREFLSRDL